MSIGFIFGAGIAILLIIGAGILSGRRVKTAQDFTVGGGAGTFLTVGALMTTLLGGNATVGTAQLSYVYGLSGWWFTIGAGIGCALMALFTSDKLRRSAETTIGAIIGREFGGGIRTLSSLCVAAGSLLNLVTQLLSGAAIMTTLLPGTPAILRVCLVAALVLLYVIFGGAMSTGTVGVVKTLLMFPAVLLCGALAYKAAGGWEGISVLPADRYFDLFARGVGTDLGAGLSTALGIVASQPYATAVLGARDARTARRALWISAIMSPFLGIGGILVGLAMRLNAPAGITANTVAMTAAAKTAFSDFVQANCPPFLCGLILASLLIAAAGTSAGLLLGAATILHRDLVDRITDRFRDPVRGLRFSRVCLVLLLAAGTGCALIPTSFIIDLGFLSLGLRAATMLAPLLAALHFTGRASRRTALLSVLAGLAVTVLAQALSLGISPSLAGIIASLLVMAAGLLFKRKPVQ